MQCNWRSIQNAAARRPSRRRGRKNEQARSFAVLGNDGELPDGLGLPQKMEGAGCLVHEIEVSGSVAAEVATAGKADEVGKEGEAKVQELKFPTTPSEKVWVEKEGKLEEEPVRLKFGGDKAVASGTSDVEAKTSEPFGASTRPTEDLGWHVAGRDLGKEEPVELAPGSGEFTLTHTSGIKIKCTGQEYEKGTLEGASNGNASTIKVAHLNFSGCTVTGNGTGCSVFGLIKTEALEGRLAYATKERTGKIMVLFGNDGSSPTKWWLVKFAGAGCTDTEAELYGSAVTEVVTAGTPDEVGSEAEAKDEQFRLPTSEIEKVWVEKEGKLIEEPVRLQLSGMAGRAIRNVEPRTEIRRTLRSLHKRVDLSRACTTRASLGAYTT